MIGKFGAPRAVRLQGGRVIACALLMAVQPGLASADDAGEWLSKSFTERSSPGGPSYLGASPSRGAADPGGSLSGGGVTWQASSGCLNSTLQGVVAQMQAYGSVTVTSTCRGPGQNAAAGGAPRSQHLSGDAVDFRLNGNVAAAMQALQANGALGGVKMEGNGIIHVDTGPKRSW